MHAISLQVLRAGIIEKLKVQSGKLIDFGCGFGYSTLSFAILADQLKLKGKLNVIGVDLYEDFITRAFLNSQKYKPLIKNSSTVNIDFQVFDYLDVTSTIKGIKEGEIDFANFGFETSLETLNNKAYLFSDKALIIAPISADPQGSLEQTYTLLSFNKGNQTFDIVSEIMKTSFSQRVDKQKQINDSLDQDFFGNHSRHKLLKQFKDRITHLEQQFIVLKKQQPGITQLKELMKNPEIKAVLIEIGDLKKKVQKLEFAIRDSTVE